MPIKLACGRVTWIDCLDYEIVAPHRWSLNLGRYAGTRIKGSYVMMHRLIVNTPKGLLVDHINGDGLDNRRANLRSVTPAQNAWNSASRLKGRDLPRGVWRVGNGFASRINVARKEIYLGVFETAEEASAAYVAACAKHHGEHSFFASRGQK